MANEKISSSPLHGFEYSKVDTAPGSEGFGTNSVFPSKVNNQHQELNFSIRDLTEGAAMELTVTLQFQCDGDGKWTDYASYDSSGRWIIDGRGLKVQWRAVVKQGSYTSGVVRFGFDY